MLRARSAVSATQVHSKGGMDHGQCSGGCSGEKAHTLEVVGGDDFTKWHWY